MIDNLVPAYRFWLVIPIERFWASKEPDPVAALTLLHSMTCSFHRRRMRAVIGQTIARYRALEEPGGSGHRNADALEVHR
jgi:hypothetical protein